jgi:peptidoglycan/LPS O-acetylase OafA/YrhL
MPEAVEINEQVTPEGEASQQRFNSLTDHRLNNFDFLRFVAASMVILSHSFVLLGKS